MKIKKLQIYGFKTFPQPTEVTFHDGVTTVVGPNGCGKSNLIDALRWVMGEKSAKGLRGGSMSDVIFSGCQTRNALNFAEVTLTLAEVEGMLPEKYGNYHEIAVTRRLHSNGDSEYLINKTPCRLRDIVDLFLDTGLGKRAYSIVEQGRIDAILSSKPIERRFLIEEAAGLSKYRARRDEAINKMKRADTDLERINDIVGEVRREMNSLKRQASRTTAFKALRAEREEVERDLLVSAWLAHSGELSQATASRKEAEERLVASRASSDKLMVDLESYRLSMLDGEKSIEESQRHVYGLSNQISERETRGRFLEQEAESLALRSTRSKEEAAELLGRSEELAAEQTGLEQQLEELSMSTDELAAKAEEFNDASRDALEGKREAEAALEEHRKHIFTNQSEMTRVNADTAHAHRTHQNALSRMELFDKQHQEIQSKIDEVRAESQTQRSSLGAAEKALQRSKTEHVRLGEDMEDLVFDRANYTRKVEELSRELSREQSRLKGLEELKDSMECYGTGVKSILRHSKENKWLGVRGVVADAISVPPRFEAALEAALGERLQYVVVADSAQAVDAVEHLKSTESGRASMAPVDVRELRAPTMPKPGAAWAHGALLGLVKITTGFDRLATTLLGGFYVVDTLANALELWNAGAAGVTFVTLEGETVSAEGVVTGGRGKGQEAGLLRRNREIRELSQRVSELSAQLAEAQISLDEARHEHEEAEKRLTFYRDEAHRHELMVANVSRDMAQFEERRERLEERKQALEYEREELCAEVERLAEEQLSLEARREELLVVYERSEEEQQALRETLTLAGDKAERLRADFNALNVRLAADRQRKEGLSHQIHTLSQSRSNVAVRAGKLSDDAGLLMGEQTKRVAERQKMLLELDALTVELGRRKEQADKLLQQHDQRRTDVAGREKEATEARRAAQQLQDNFNGAELSVRELEMKADTLRERFAERVKIDMEEAVEAGLPEEFDAEASGARIAQLEEKIGRFGDLNLMADTEYEERKERFEFLDGQREDLQASIAKFQQAIRRINRVSRERFQETFDQVNAKFQQVYPNLFRGGEAKLYLTDPENMLETGIDIVARPPGKKSQHISLLSGGEKALTAVALIFSLFLVKPSPFCVLDEVDAPLDDANVERFSQMLREMATNSQFLVITHNKITMECADHLYGITMEEPGVSNVVSVRFTSDLKEAVG